MSYLPQLYEILVVPPWETKPLTLGPLGNFNILAIAQVIFFDMGSFKHQCFLSFFCSVTDKVSYCSTSSWLNVHVTMFSCWLGDSGRF